MRRRGFLAAAALAGWPGPTRGDSGFAPVVARPLVFPRDYGSHPQFRTEWWYLTAWIHDGALQRGVQITFFRRRPGVAENLASAFAPRQILFAHAALADPRLGRLLHDQRAGRAVLGLARAAEDTTDLALDDWRLALDDSTYRVWIPAREFTLDLTFRAASPVLLEGDAGVSRKGPLAAQSSYYYSRPQLHASGKVVQGSRSLQVDGIAWLDHEWSSEYLAPGARGWDWTGINLDDGGALMAFRIRESQGGTLWAGGTWRRAGGTVEHFGPGEIAFEPTRIWRSPRTGIDYPVEMKVRAGPLSATLVPLFDDQELDARASVGTVYWEGAVQATGTAAGRGYLELTGYGAPLKL